MPWDQNLTALRDLLADLYETDPKQHMVVDEAEVDRSVPVRGRGQCNWYDILIEARKQGKNGALLEVVPGFPGNREIQRLMQLSDLLGDPRA